MYLSLLSAVLGWFSILYREAKLVECILQGALYLLTSLVIEYDQNIKNVPTFSQKGLSLIGMSRCQQITQIILNIPRTSSTSAGHPNVNIDLVQKVVVLWHQQYATNAMAPTLWHQNYGTNTLASTLCYFAKGSSKGQCNNPFMCQ